MRLRTSSFAGRYDHEAAMQRARRQAEEPKNTAPQEQQAKEKNKEETQPEQPTR